MMVRFLGIWNYYERMSPKVKAADSKPAIVGVQVPPYANNVKAELRLSLSLAGEMGALN